MTEHPGPAGRDWRDASAIAARRDRAATSRPRPRRRHPAQGARIAAVGIGTAIMAGLVGVMGYFQPASAQPKSPAPPVTITYGSDIASAIGASEAGSLAPSAGNTTLTARPSVRSAPPADPAPAASTSGSH